VATFIAGQCVFKTTDIPFDPVHP